MDKRSVKVSEVRAKEEKKGLLKKLTERPLVERKGKEMEHGKSERWKRRIK